MRAAVRIRWRKEEIDDTTAATYNDGKCSLPMEGYPFGRARVGGKLIERVCPRPIAISTIPAAQKKKIDINFRQAFPIRIVRLFEVHPQIDCN